MQFQTFWQPAYTPPKFVYPSNKRGPVKSGKDFVIEYLEKHGAKSNTELQKALGVTKQQLRYASSRLPGILICEQSGNGKNRVCLYWSANNPPPVSLRCATHRAYEWIKKHPWRPAADIPSDIYPVHKHKHAGVCTMERNGRLISRVKNGKKQYKAVV